MAAELDSHTLPLETPMEFKFTELPLELRRMVYHEYILTQTINYELESSFVTDDTTAQQKARTTLRKLLDPLSLVSKAVRDEFTEEVHLLDNAENALYRFHLVTPPIFYPVWLGLVPSRCPVNDMKRCVVSLSGHQNEGYDYDYNHDLASLLWELPHTESLDIEFNTDKPIVIEKDDYCHPKPVGIAEVFESATNSVGRASLLRGVGLISYGHTQLQYHKPLRELRMRLGDLYYCHRYRMIEDGMEFWYRTKKAGGEGFIESDEFRDEK